MTPMIHRRDLLLILGVCGKTLSKYIKTDVIPEPDLAVSPREQWWKPDTLEAAGVAVKEKTDEQVA